MLGQSEQIGQRIYSVVLVFEPTVVHAERLVEIGSDQPDADFLGPFPLTE